MACPYGYESGVYGGLLTAEGFVPDRFGNWHLSIGQSSTLFLAHLDTAGGELLPIPVKRVGDFISSGNDTPLGADDRAGVTVILWMVRNCIPGHYILTVGEEVGCIGMRSIVEQEPALLHNCQRAVSFDRKGTGSIVTHQMGRQCCSDDFAEALAEEAWLQGLEWLPDPGGAFTDSYELRGIVPECTNVSVGYLGHHTSSEVQDVAYLTRLCKACCRIEWEKLPVARTPTDDEWEEWRNGWSKDEEGWREATIDVSDAWVRVEYALMYGEKPEGKDLRLIFSEDPDEAMNLLMYYLGEDG